MSTTIEVTPLEITRSVERGEQYEETLKVGNVGDELGDDVHVAVEYLAESFAREVERPAVGFAHALPASCGFDDGVEDEAHELDRDRDLVAVALHRVARPLEGLG